MENPSMRYAPDSCGFGAPGLVNGLLSGSAKGRGYPAGDSLAQMGDESSGHHRHQHQHQHQEDIIDRSTRKSHQDNGVGAKLTAAHQSYSLGRYKDAQALCEAVYRQAAYRTDNLLLLGAVHFQLRNFSECVLYNQQCIRIDPNFAEAYSNLGNALKELGDIAGAVQFYLKAVKLKPRFCDAYNNLASAYMQLGQTQEAISTYQMALELNRGLVDAHSNLGNLYKAQGMLVEAKRCYLEAIRIRPTFSIAWSNLAGIFKEEGNLTTAVAYYREAIRLCPEFADAHSNLGNVLKEQGLVEDAMQCYQTAIRLRPDFAIAYGNLASCYYDAGRQELAIRTFRYAIQLEPNFPDAYNNLGNALREAGQLDEAINCYRTTLRLKPDHPHAYNNLGNAMKDRGLIKEAIHCYVTAVTLMPRFAAVHSNLGSVLKEQGKLVQALGHYQEAIAIDPNFADAYSNMGNAYKDLGRLQDAIKCYGAAIRIKPTFADAYSNLASAYKEGGDVLQAISCYRKALALRPEFPDAFANLVHSLVFVCDWSNRDNDFAVLRKILAAQMATDNVLPSVQPFHAMAYPLSPAEMQQISCKYAERVKMNVALLEMPRFRFRRKSRGSRVRVGYVSSDLGNHPLSHLMQSVFGMHDRSRFEVKCYALTAKDDSVWRRKIESESEHFCDVSALQNGDVARLIHSDGIDILINLNGYTKGARNEIFALQPAPVQISYLGFCGTLGADFIDYMIADETVVTPESRPFYTEKIINMPHSYFVNDHKQSARYVLDRSQLPTRATYGVPEDRFVFCNFNQLYKMDPDIFSTWMAVLRRVPNAVLWLLRFPPAGEANIRAEARKRGVRDDQLHFTDVAAKEEHIKRGYLADLFLDTPSCNAHTTGCDILWGGTPMLTMAGQKMATRVALSLLKAAGAEEMIVDSLEAYEELAVTLATDPDKLFQIRSRLEEGRHTCPLFDTQRWVKNMESGLMMAHERYVAGLPLNDLKIQDCGVVSSPSSAPVLPRPQGAPPPQGGSRVGSASSVPASAATPRGGVTCAAMQLHQEQQQQQQQRQILSTPRPSSRGVEAYTKARPLASTGVADIAQARATPRGNPVERNAIAGAAVARATSSGAGHAPTDPSRGAVVADAAAPASSAVASARGSRYAGDYHSIEGDHGAAKNYGSDSREVAAHGAGVNGPGAPEERRGSGTGLARPGEARGFSAEQAARATTGVACGGGSRSRARENEIHAVWRTELAGERRLDERNRQVEEESKFRGRKRAIDETGLY